jgi:hypothetical protein
MRAYEKLYIAGLEFEIVEAGASSSGGKPFRCNVLTFGA